MNTGFSNGLTYLFPVVFLFALPSFSPLGKHLFGQAEPPPATKTSSGDEQTDDSSGAERSSDDQSEEKPKYTKPTKAEIRRKLSPLQYRVTQSDATEPAFRNRYWKNKRAGIYVDIVSGEPLFSSLDKFKSGTGWPSFTRPLVSKHIVERTDRKFFYTRIEVRSKYADSHLGHVFRDGPAPTGLRYCMNSAALRFVPFEDLEKEGYAEFVKLFEKK